MIPNQQEALDEVRGEVIRRLRRRRRAKRGAITALLLGSLVFLLPREKPVKQYTAEATSAPIVEPVSPPVKVVRASVVMPRKHTPAPRPRAEPPGYIKLYTSNPDVVFLLLTSNEGGL